MSPRDRPRIVVTWENLSPGTQLALALPFFVLVLWGLHVVLLAQPLLRGLAYGVFWGVMGSVAVVAASRAERARRLARERARELRSRDSSA